MIKFRFHVHFAQINLAKNTMHSLFTDFVKGNLNTLVLFNFRPGCANGGLCVDPDVCSCPDGYTGARCQTGIDILCTIPNTMGLKNPKPWIRKVRTSSCHLLAEIRAIHAQRSEGAL